MGVDLKLWALHPSNKTYTIYSLERTSSFWNDIKRVESIEVPKNFCEYEAYEFYDQNVELKKSAVRRRKNQDSCIRKRKAIKKELPIDAYGKDLVSIKAIYLKILVTDDSIRFERQYEKNIFLELGDDVDVILYWC